jgi:hypothetical protein
MSAAAKTPVALGFRAQRGGSVVVGVALEAGAPRVVLNAFLATAAPGDRLAFEPYHVVYEMAGGPTREAAPAAVVSALAEARGRQDALAASGLAAILEQLAAAGSAGRVGALLVNRAGWMIDDLPHALRAPEHPPVLEGLAVRDALRFALGHCRLAATETDEKSLPDTASVVLGASPGALEAQLKALGASAGKPWRKEQKSACLAAWLALAAP